MKKLTALALFALLSPWLLQAVTLEFKGNETLEVSKDVAERSGIIKHLLGDLEADDKTLIPLYEVTLKEWDTVAPLLEVTPDQVSTVIGEYTIDQLITLITPLNYLEAEPELEAVLQALEGKLIARYAEHDYAQLTKAIESMCKLGLSAYLQSRINFNILKTVIHPIPTTINSNTLPGHEHAISGLVVSKNGKKLYSASLTNLDPGSPIGSIRSLHTAEIKVWNINPQGLSLAQTIEAHRDWISSLIMNAEGTKLYSGSLDGTVKIWKIKADGNLDLEHTIQIPEIQPAQILRHPTRHYASLGVSSLALSPDGTKLYASSENETITIWNLTEQGANLAHTIDLFTNIEPVIAEIIALSPDGRTLFAGTRDGRFFAWNVAENTPVELSTGSYGYRIDDINSFAFNSDGSRLYSASSSIKIWDITNQRPQLIATQNQPPMKHGVQRLSMSPDSKMLYGASLIYYKEHNPTISAWKVLADGQIEPSYTLDQSNGYTEDISALAVGPDGTLYSGSRDGTIKMIKMWKTKASKTLTLIFETLEDLSCRQALLIIKLHQAKENEAQYKLCKDEKEHVFNGLPAPLKEFYKDAYELTDQCADTDEEK